uniref:Secreted protein n=1 Tax=Romanomermis culicivorax TaxID=13658 RepID=A0A915KXK9_ROMCU
MDSLWALVLIVGGNVATASTDWAIQLACSMAQRMVSTAGDDGSPSNTSLSKGVSWIVPLEMDLRAPQVTSGPNICNAMGAKSTTSVAMSASTLKS